MSRTVSFQRVPINRGGNGYLIEGYTFRCDKRHADRISLKCTELGKPTTRCLARATLFHGADKVAFRGKVEHNHPPPVKNETTGFWQMAKIAAGVDEAESGCTKASSSGGGQNPLAFTQPDGMPAIDAWKQAWLNTLAHQLDVLRMAPLANQLDFPWTWPSPVTMPGASKKSKSARHPEAAPSSSNSKDSHSSTFSDSSKAPIYLDVGGVRYTSTMVTLTRYPESFLAKLVDAARPVNGGKCRPITIDRDGASFRHVLNFLRTGRLLIPDDFTEIDLLEVDARFYGLDDLLVSIVDWNALNKISTLGDDSFFDEQPNTCDTKASSNQNRCESALGHPPIRATDDDGEMLVVSVHKVDDGEEVLVSGKEATIVAVFPDLEDVLLGMQLETADGYILALNVNTHCPKFGSRDVVMRRLIDGEGFVLESTKQLAGGGTTAVQYVLVRK